jgi:NADPH2:quinone reductase
MKAARVHRFGEALRIDEVDEPSPGAGEVLATVRFVAVNPQDVWLTRGTVAGGRQPLPFVPGTEATVEAEGRQWIAGGGGYGLVRDGFYTERVAIGREYLTPLPEGADPAQASALRVAGVTAWRLVNDVTRVAEGDRVLVLGASGGVGNLLIQLARTRGAVVWGQTGSHDKAYVITELGAERAVVADAGELVDAAADLKPTVVFDPLGGPFTPAAVQLLQPHGRLGLFGASAGPEMTLPVTGVYRKGLSILGYGGVVEAPERISQALGEVLAELAAGRLRVPIGEVLPLQSAAEAHRRILERGVSGKVLLQP